MAKIPTDAETSGPNFQRMAQMPRRLALNKNLRRRPSQAYPGCASLVKLRSWKERGFWSKVLPAGLCMIRSYFYIILNSILVLSSLFSTRWNPSSCLFPRKRGGTFRRVGGVDWRWRPRHQPSHCCSPRVRSYYGASSLRGWRFTHGTLLPGLWS
jgi:hypothetical protein